MTEQAEISTPADATVTDTTVDTAPDTDTASTVPDTADTTAETTVEGNDEGTKLYAGKYKTTDELEKGYLELQKLQSRPNEYEQKYNELIKKQQDAEQKQAQTELQNAKNRGFKSVEEQQIYDTVQSAELEWYANNLAYVSLDNFDSARQCLGDYLRTGQIDYLNEAKKYFPLDVVENIAKSKIELNTKLQQQAFQRQKTKRDEFNKNLAEQIKTNFAEFLADSEENTPKASALKAMCDVGVINSLDDMQNFVNLYSDLAENIKKQAIEEYKASQVIDNTKEKSVIDNANIAGSGIPTDGMPTYQQLVNMSQEEYNKAVEKYGLERLLQAK